MSTFDEQLDKIRTASGFLAALDQSGGSTPKALKLYGIDESSYSNETEMFDAVHAMRVRIITSPSFDGQRVLGAILFENTLDRDIAGVNSARFLWDEKHVVPFLKVDKGLMEEAEGVQLMKPMPQLPDLLNKARAQPIFGTKMRSVIKLANNKGIAAIVSQQFEVAQQIMAAGLVPIIEPEVDINSPEKAAAEEILRAELSEHLDALRGSEQIMLKLTLPEEADFYRRYVDHLNVLKVVALSGGYTREEANAKVAENHGVIASFSRALTEGLSVHQHDDTFNADLERAVESIYQASCS